MPPAKRFRVAAGTAPSADEAVPAPVEPPAAAPASRPGPGKADDRIAYTWRLTADQVMDHDDLMAVLRRATGQPRLDKATVLNALMRLAAESKAVQGALIAQLDRS